MNQKELDCRVTFTDDTIIINSGLPESEPVIEQNVGCHSAKIDLRQNASATIVLNPQRNIVPPFQEDVLRDYNLTVKRTTRNFIVTMKFPIIEDSDATAQAHKDMWKKSQKAITSAREEIKQKF